MVDLYDTQQDRLNREVARRLDLINENPDVMMRYDANGDGVLDRDEWEVVRSLVRRQVLDEFQHSHPGESVPEPEQPASGLGQSGLGQSGLARSGLEESEPSARRDQELPVDDASFEEEWGVDTDPQIDLTVREKIGQRYDVLHELGRGSQGKTFLGRDVETNRFVAIKELAVGQLDDWKSLELFEREAEVLKRLEHVAIPTFIDALEIEDAGQMRFFLVQEFVDGETLDAELEHVGHFRPVELEDLAEQVLDVLVYLQSLDPPVIHRDIKPSNIIRRASGQVALVDFGGVRSGRETGRAGGSTVVGTTGYMPPEQLMGRASKATDLFALGATLIHLATGHHPAKISQSRSKFDWRGYGSIDGPLAEFIDRLVEPIAEDRFASAAEASQALAQIRATHTQEPETAMVATGDWVTDIAPAETTWRRPVNSYVTLERSVEAMTVRIPARLNPRKLMMAAGGFAPFVVTLASSSFDFNPFILIAMVGFGIWNLIFAHTSYSFDATPDSWAVVERFWGIPFESTGDSHRFRGGRVERRVRRGKYGRVRRVEYMLQITANDMWHDIDVHLSKEEKDWIAAEMNAFASDVRKVRLLIDGGSNRQSSS